MPDIDEAPAAPAPTTPAGRNLVVCCDGTSNEFGETNTNVVRLVQSLVQDQLTQMVYYDPGVGTMPEPGLLLKPLKTLSKVAGLAFGLGLVRNVEEAYRFLMNSYRPGDQVYLFGFSRGAYTVRVLAGMLHQMGLLARGQEQLVPYAVRLYRKATKAEKPDSQSKYYKLCGDFRNTFSQEVPGQETRQFPVGFLGLWDTVSSVGWAWDPKTFRFTAHNRSVRTVRHAISLDERRAFFRQNLFYPEKPSKTGKPIPQDVIEQWFAGCHSDIGGGYSPSRGALWRCAFDWIVDEAAKAGLRFDQSALKEIRAIPAAPALGWGEGTNESLTPLWWPAEFFPKISPVTRRPVLGLFRTRPAAGALLHESVLNRIRANQTYRPRNVPEATIKEILELPAVLPGMTVRIPRGSATAGGAE